MRVTRWSPDNLMLKEVSARVGFRLAGTGAWHSGCLFVFYMPPRRVLKCDFINVSKLADPV